MLAQAARRAGLTPIVIDLFGDQDTYELALAVQTVEALTETAVSRAIDALSARIEITAAVYGSGLETHAASLDYLFARLPVFGNTPATCRRLHDKRKFFAVLHKWGMTYPLTCFTPPKTAGEWLIKPYYGEGGAQISFYESPAGRSAQSNGARGTPYENIYWQRYQRGVAMSALFLADTHKAQVVAFNRQWTTTFPGRPFVFSGVMSHAQLPDAEKRRLAKWLNALTSEFSLTGLNSLDFIWDGQQLWVLEINPRPSASIALYDDYCAGGLLAAHLAACRGALRQFEMQNASCSAYQIVYAPSDCRIPSALNWPVWANDKPQADSFIRAGTPICSIMARGEPPQQLWALLRARRQLIFDSIHANIENHAIHSER